MVKNGNVFERLESLIRPMPEHGSISSFCKTQPKVSVYNRLAS